MTCAQRRLRSTWASTQSDQSLGFSQGSVLGPLLFSLYVDLPLHINFCDLDLFADDATTTAANASLSVIVNLIITDLLDFEKWCTDNHMTLNLAKPNAVFISTIQKINKIMEDPPDITLNGESIQITDQEKLLGINIDNTLSWCSHVDKTLKRCNTLRYLLSRIKQYLSISVRKLFFNAYILPHLDYCWTIWANGTFDSLNSLIKFQKRAARLILNKDVNTASEELFAELN